jgi:hypothetical protein
LSVVDKYIDLGMAAGDSVAVVGWRRVFDEVVARIGGRFARAEPRRTVGELLAGLLTPLERKNGWWLAEHAGHASPDRMHADTKPPPAAATTNDEQPAPPADGSQVPLWY